MHSGAASGVVPSTFRIARHLLERVEDAATGEIRCPSSTTIPDDRRRQAEETAGDARLRRALPLRRRRRPVTDDPVEQILAHTWKPTLSVVGADGLPPTNRAGNVLRPSTSLQLSFRLPRPATPTPHWMPSRRSPPIRPTAHGDLRRARGRTGWNAPTFAPWLESSLRGASQAAPVLRPEPSARAARSCSWGCSVSASRCAVRDHRRARSRQQRPRAQRVPPPADPERLTAALAMVLHDHARR